MSHRPETASVEDWLGDRRIEAYPIPNQSGSISDTVKIMPPIPHSNTSDESVKKSEK